MGLKIQVIHEGIKVRNTLISRNEGEERQEWFIMHRENGNG